MSLEILDISYSYFSTREITIEKQIIVVIPYFIGIFMFSCFQIFKPFQQNLTTAMLCNQKELQLEWENWLGIYGWLTIIGYGNLWTHTIPLHSLLAGECGMTLSKLISYNLDFDSGCWRSRSRTRTPTPLRNVQKPKSFIAPSNATAKAEDRRAKEQASSAQEQRPVKKGPEWPSGMAWYLSSCCYWHLSNVWIIPSVYVFLCCVLPFFYFVLIDTFLTWLQLY